MLSYFSISRNINKYSCAIRGFSEAIIYKIASKKCKLFYSFVESLIDDDFIFYYNSVQHKFLGY